MADDNEATSVIDAVVVESVLLRTKIAASRGDGVSDAMEDAAGSADSLSSPSNVNIDRGGAGVDNETTKVAAADVKKAKAKSLMLAQII